MDKPELSARFVGPIYDRIGPIVDPAFLNLLNQEQVKNVALTVARAELNAATAQTKALQDIVTIMEAVNVSAKST